MLVQKTWHKNIPLLRPTTKAYYLQGAMGNRDSYGEIWSLGTICAVGLRLSSVHQNLLIFKSLLGVYAPCECQSPGLFGAQAL